MTKFQRFEDWKKRLHLRGRGRFGLPHLLMSGFAVGVILGLLLIGGLPVPGASWLARAFPKYQVCVSSAQRNCVVDGDTIRHNGETIGLEDIDAPKVGKPECLSELELGKRAKLRLVELINEDPFDITRSGDRDIDEHGRKLRTLLRNGHSLGMQLVDEGLAVPWAGRRHNWCE